jgi:hypothetical protein
VTTRERIDWSDTDAAAKLLAGNWQDFECFAWSRGYRLPDADQWTISYTSHPGDGILAQSNEAIINKRLEPFSEGDDPDLVFERHSHWAVGHIDGFSIRVFRDDGNITDAFKEFCRIKEKLDEYPILDEQDYSEREYEATLENYCHEMWREEALPQGWEAEVYSWFCDNGKDSCIENADDQGGYAPRDAIIEALQDLGLIPTVTVDNREP